MNDTLQGLILGCLLGFILGYLTNHVRNIERKLTNVEENLSGFDACVKKCKEDHEHIPPRRNSDEGGFMRRPSWVQIMAFCVVAIVVVSTFMTSRVNSKVTHVVECLTQYNTVQGQALSGRDDAIKTSADAEIDLWTLYDRLYQIAENDPKKIPIVQKRLNHAITDYRDKLVKTQNTRDIYDYADPDILKDCKENS